MARDGAYTAEHRASARRPFCVCVPARDEEERVPRLFDALARQSVEGSIPVAICLNNSSDGSADAVFTAMSRYRDRLLIECDIRDFPPDLAHAGSARAAAMAMGVKRLGGSGGVLITTDADARPPEDWIEANLDAVAAGADIVGGRLVLDEHDSIPPAVIRGRALWDRYWAAVRRIEDELDPSPWDIPPRHGDHTGGSLALTSEIYAKSGGVPLLASGEDRALVEAAVIAGGRLVHPMSVWTRVSARSQGRASGGMAEMMRRMADTAAPAQALMAPRLEHWRGRSLWRRDMRRQPGGASGLTTAERSLPPMPHDADLTLMDLPS
ncbi:glycosyltransferase family A protein [Bosea sp. PAMC 26642]|uniref:glycosyltransferase family A protein n=1 Tax=Bosea sp. (strain PAMC 26642) TaxID=1792307 RepID=UPI000770165C|nr:glycosyltransferase family A protein [Bosea sp. PAMC 26642]AMJ60269.1 glycosyl transferase family 2 [Bosea sp. PAMC 26642]